MRRALLLPTVLLLGCPGETNLPPGKDVGGGSSDHPIWPDLPRAGELGAIVKDLPAVCGAFAKEGTSCETASCPAGLIPAILDGKSCTCHVACNPDQGKRCAPESCGRLCVQLMDSGKPLPGQGACTLDTGSGAGEPCPPACKLDLTCIAHGTAASFCRQSCTGAGDCTGYKLVCVPSSGGGNVCVPGGSTTGPKLGESCAGTSDLCVQDLLCDPVGKTCVRACSPSGTACATPKQCTKLVDATGVVIGYGCK